MKHIILAAAIFAAPVSVLAQPSVTGIVDEHILPRFATLSKTAAGLRDAASQDCAPTSDALRDAYNTAFDAWIAASHLRFGPTEVDDRAFALAFWPDSRGATPRALSSLIADQDPIAADPDAYKDVSIAARGFYALEFLLYDATLSQTDNASYHCTLVRTISADIAATSAAIYHDWRTRYADVITAPGPDAPYRNTQEALQEMLRALSTGLQFTHDTRLGRPLGTFDRPRPARAEAWRSGRSARHVRISLVSLRDLAARLAAGDAELLSMLNGQFDTALGKLDALDDPRFQGVADPQSRLRIEVVQQAVNTIRTTVQMDLGPTLGVAAGFNSLDGD